MESATPAPIVVIEDHPEHLDYLATLLRRAGYVVAAFDNAMHALRYMAHCPVSLVITDVFMPEMDGFEVLRTLQQSHPGVPLIAVSGAASRDDADFLACMKTLGARAVFTKPLDATALLGAASLLAGGDLGPNMIQPISLRQKADACRRLARLAREADIVSALLELAEDFEQAASDSEAQGQPQQTPDRKDDC